MAEQVSYLNFIFNGREYLARYNDDGEVASIYDYVEHRHLSEDTDRGIRENPSVWVVAYSMLDY